MIILDKIKSLFADYFPSKFIDENNTFLSSFDYVQMYIDGKLKPEEIKQLRYHLYTKINDTYSFTGKILEEFPDNLPEDILRVIISEAFRFNATGKLFLDDQSFYILNGYIQHNPHLIRESLIQALEDLPLNFKSNHVDYYEKFGESFLNAIEHFNLIPHITSQHIHDLKKLHNTIKKKMVYSPKNSEISLNGLNLRHSYFKISHEDFSKKLDLLSDKVSAFEVKKDFKENLIQELEQKESLVQPKRNKI